MATTTVNEVISFIWSGRCSLEDRRRIVNALNEQHKVAAHSASAQLVPGDRVQFTNKTGTLIKGVITKVNRMSVHVRGDHAINWRVSPQVLQRSEPLKTIT